MVTIKSKNNKSKASSKAPSSSKSNSSALECEDSCSANLLDACCANVGLDTWEDEAPWTHQARWHAQTSWTPKLEGTQLCARADIGFGNQLFIRGEGCGLSWERGLPMTCEGSNCWLWQPEAWAQSSNPSEMIQFKVLVNDQVWSDGPNCCVNTQCALHWQPTFSQWQG